MDGVNPRATIQKVNLEEDSLRIQVPFSMSVSGPSQSKIDILKLFRMYFIKIFVNKNTSLNKVKLNYVLKKYNLKYNLSILRRWKI